VRPPRILRRDTLRQDATAGLVLGVESVPDGLAGGLLAGVNPVFGLYGYLFGLSAAFATSSAFMAVQATGAMAMVIGDVDVINQTPSGERALFTLAVLTGALMIVAGVLKLGTMLRFVSHAVMVGFINAVGVNIILGQVSSFTGYEGDGSNRILRTIDSLLHVFDWEWATVAIGAATIVLIVVLEHTRLGAMGMVLAIVVTSAVTVVFGLDSVARLDDIASIPSSLPRPQLPDFGLVLTLLVPALSLTFVGLVQGAGITAGFQNPDGTQPDASRDFVGQGVGNIVSGLFRGMPVGGSMSATSLNKSAGARSKQSLLIAAAVMAVIIVLFADLVSLIAMPALAGLLMLVGYRTVKPQNIIAVVRAGIVSATVLGVTFVLTMVIPLQYAVLIGVGVSVILFVINESNRVTLSRWTIRPEDDAIIEGDAPATVPGHSVLILLPYGSLFFASAPVFESLLPEVTSESGSSVVILRLRGHTDLGTTFCQVLRRYAQQLDDVGSKLAIVSADETIREQLRVTGVTALIGEDNIYERDERLAASVRRAHRDALAWIDHQTRG
jgi:SulP family sulfate permease